jgi:hypothetical protein
LILSLIVALAVSAPSKEPISLASPGLSHLNLSQETATYYSDHLAQQLALEGMRVITTTEISSLIGFERQKQLLGCSDTSSSCIAELANALGVDGLITGSIGKFGKKYQVNLKILAASDGKPLSVHSARVVGEEALLDELTAAGTKMGREVHQKLRGGTATKAAPPPPAHTQLVMPPPPKTDGSSGATASVSRDVEPAKPGVRRYAWIPAAAGVAGIGVGVAFMLMSGGSYSKLENAVTNRTPLTGETALDVRRRGETQQTISLIGFGVGAAGLLAGGAMYLWGAPSPSSNAVSWSITPGAGGGVVSVKGAFW